MTVSTTDNRIAYSGNAVTTVFDFPYKFLATSDLNVYVGGVLKTLTTDYSVGAPSDDGASVTFVTAPAAGTNNIVILRDPDTLQQSELPSNGPFPSLTVEQMVDKVTLQVQRLKDLISRSFTLSDSDTSGAATAIPTPSAGKALKWAPDGLSIINSTYDPDENAAASATSAAAAAASAADAASSASSAASIYDQFDDRYLGSKAADPTLDNDGNALLTGALYFNNVSNKLKIYNGAAWQDTATAAPASFTSNVYSGNAVTTAFTLSTTPASTASVFVFVSGVAQRPTTDYTISGTTLNFVAAPPAGVSNVLAFVAATVSAGAPDDGSVSTAKIQDLAVTNAKMAQQYVNDLTTVTFDPNADFVAIADASDSGNKKKAAIRQMVAGTSVSSTSGTAIDFTGIPSWAKRITVILNGVSLSATSSILVQLGISTGPVTSGYNSYLTASQAAALTTASSTAGFLSDGGSAGITVFGTYVFVLQTGNTWVGSHSYGGVNAGNNRAGSGGGSIALAAALDRVRITSTGADTFDAGSINVIYE